MWGLCCYRHPGKLYRNIFCLSLRYYDLRRPYVNIAWQQVMLTPGTEGVLDLRQYHNLNTPWPCMADGSSTGINWQLRRRYSTRLYTISQTLEQSNYKWPFLHKGMHHLTDRFCLKAVPGGPGITGCLLFLQALYKWPFECPKWRSKGTSTATAAENRFLGYPDHPGTGCMIRSIWYCRWAISGMPKGGPIKILFYR